MRAEQISADFAELEAGSSASIDAGTDRDGAAMEYLRKWLTDRSELWLKGGRDLGTSGAESQGLTVTGIQMSDFPDEHVSCLSLSERPASASPPPSHQAPGDSPKRRDLDSFDFVAFRDQHAPVHQPLVAATEFDPSDEASISAAVARIMSVISSKRFRRGPASDFAACSEEYSARATSFVRAGRAVELVMPAFPVKCFNPLKVERRGIDLGEVITLCRLYELCRAVERVYPPGAIFHAIADGLVYAPLFEEPSHFALAYRRQLEHVTRLLGIEAYVRITDMAWLIRDDPAIQRNFEDELPRSAHVVAALWSDASKEPEALRHRDALISATRGNANVTDIPRELLAAVLLGRSSGEMNPVAVEEARVAIDAKARRCAFNYLVFVRAINTIGVVARSFPGALRVTCHPKVGQLGLHLVHPSSFNYPWNGIPVVLNNGQARPFRIKMQEDVREDARHRAVHLKGDPFPFYYEQISGAEGEVASESEVEVNE